MRNTAKLSKPFETSDPSKQKIYDEIMFNEAGSSNDCTGLIPSEVMTEDEYKSYEDMYNFNLPESVRKDIE